MGYRINYEAYRGRTGIWLAAGVCTGLLSWAAMGLSPVWSAVAAGEGLYDALARFVGGMILGTN